MFTNVVALDSKKHARQKLVKEEGFSFARNVLSAPLSFSEVVKASREFPIFFPMSGKLLPIVQMGFEKDGNLYIDDNGNWTARYNPAHIRRFPFILGEKKDSDQYVVMISKDHLSPKGDGGALFVKGKLPAGGTVDRATKFLTTFQNELDQTEAILKPLLDRKIMTEKVYTFSKDDKVLGNVTGLQVIDTDKLAALDDATLAEWVRSGLMGIIMAHLHSLDNLNNSKASSN